jgi:hypothetical protein
VLGANEPFLTALRTATGGSVVETPLDPWRHDLVSTSRSTDLWPFLLVLALLLWPLDIALRRVSIGRREFAAAGAWVRGIPKRRGRTAARTAAGEGLFAARERATSAGDPPGRRLRGWSRRGSGATRLRGYDARGFDPGAGGGPNYAGLGAAHARTQGRPGTGAGPRHDGPPARRETPGPRTLTEGRNTGAMCRRGTGDSLAGCPTADESCRSLPCS